MLPSRARSSERQERPLQRCACGLRAGRGLQSQTHVVTARATERPHALRTSFRSWYSDVGIDRALAKQGLPHARREPGASSAIREATRLPARAGPSRPGNHFWPSRPAFELQTALAGSLPSQGLAEHRSDCPDGHRYKFSLQHF